MKFKDYIEEGKKMKSTMIGFGINPSSFKRLYDYIESWLIRYKIDYKKETETHFTIAQIPGTYDKDDLIRKVHEISKNITFNPRGIALFRGQRVPKDFIVCEYKPNIAFIESLNKIAKDFEIFKFAAVKPHVSLFIIEQGVLSDKLFDDMKWSMPKLPKVKAKEVELWNAKFQREYVRR